MQQKVNVEAMCHRPLTVLFFSFEQSLTSRIVQASGRQKTIKKIATGNNNNEVQNNEKKSKKITFSRAFLQD